MMRAETFAKRQAKDNSVGRKINERTTGRRLIIVSGLSGAGKTVVLKYA